MALLTRSEHRSAVGRTEAVDDRSNATLERKVNRIKDLERIRFSSSPPRFSPRSAFYETNPATNLELSLRCKKCVLRNEPSAQPGIVTSVQERRFAKRTHLRPSSLNVKLTERTRGKPRRY